MPSVRNLAGLVLALVLMAGCGSSRPSLTEYVETLNAMNEEFSPRGEAIWLEYTGRPERTVQDLRILQDSLLALRIDVADALGELEAPEQIGDLHESWIAWHSRLLAAERAQTARAATAGGVEEFVQSAEFSEWAAALEEGSALCDQFEERLNAGEAQELFADTPWMPSDLTNAVHAVIGCEAFPEDIGDVAAVFEGP